MTSRGARIQVLVGSLVLAGAGLTLLCVLLSPRVAGPTARIASALGSALDGERASDLTAPVASVEGLQGGLPAFLVDAGGNARPVAHVVDHGVGAEGPWVRLRFEPGQDPAGPWRLTCHTPSRKLRAALALAVTDEAAARFGREIAGRLRVLWDEALLPEAERHLPAFLERIDPTQDTEASGVLQGLSKSVLAQLDPLLDQLANHVTGAVKRKFDLLDRVGLLWKVVKGDAKGLKRQILPVAKASAQAWWTQNEGAVMKAIGRGIAKHGGALTDWAGGELFDAARDELVRPILAAQQERLEREGQSLLRYAAREFIEAPEGGFRVRFAAVLRMHLLNKKTALLLLERGAQDRR